MLPHFEMVCFEMEFKHAEQVTPGCRKLSHPEKTVRPLRGKAVKPLSGIIADLAKNRG